MTRPFLTTPKSSDEPTKTKLIHRVSRAGQVATGYTACLVTAAVGVGIELGTGWGMLVGGMAGAASLLFLVDVDASTR